MSIKQPFRPSGGATVNVDVAATSARVALTDGSHQRVMNNGTATVWLAFGDVTVTATTAGLPVAAGTTEVLTVPTGQTYVAAIAAGSTGKIYFTPGNGL